MFVQLQYVSDDWLYFYANPDLDEYGVYRCDFQRNNIEKVKDVAYYRLDEQVYRDTVEVVYEKQEYHFAF